MTQVTSNKETITKADVGVLNAAALTGGSETVVTVAGESKAKKAKAIFKEMFAMQPVPARKDMINRAVAEADLTQQGAATYLQNYKRDNNLSKPRAAVAPVVAGVTETTA